MAAFIPAKTPDAPAPDTSVIIAAAGKAARMGGKNKQLSLLGNLPVIGHCLRAFQAADSVREIVISARPEDISAFRQLGGELGVTKLSGICAGGETRQASVTAALGLICRESAYIAVHDGARPLVDAKEIEAVIRDAHIFGGASLGVPVKDTIKTVRDGLIVDTPPRSSLWAMQTPQVFRKSIYLEAVQFALDHRLDFTDDCQMAEAMGVKVYVTRGGYKNMKLTTPEDFLLAEALLSGREDSR